MWESEKNVLSLPACLQTLQLPLMNHYIYIQV